jgi:hypothetical protein
MAACETWYVRPWHIYTGFYGIFWLTSFYTESFLLTLFMAILGGFASEFLAKFIPGGEEVEIGANSSASAAPVAAASSVSATSYQDDFYDKPLPPEPTARDPSPEPARDMSPEPVRDPTPEPTRDMSPELARDSSPEPPARAVEEPLVQAFAEPAFESAPEPPPRRETPEPEPVLEKRHSPEPQRFTPAEEISKDEDSSRDSSPEPERFSPEPPARHSPEPSRESPKHPEESLFMAKESPEPAKEYLLLSRESPEPPKESLLMESQPMMDEEPLLPAMSKEPTFTAPPASDEFLLEKDHVESTFAPSFQAPQGGHDMFDQGKNRDLDEQMDSDNEEDRPAQQSDLFRMSTQPVEVLPRYSPEPPKESPRHSPEPPKKSFPEPLKESPVSWPEPPKESLLLSRESPEPHKESLLLSRESPESRVFSKESERFSPEPLKDSPRHSPVPTKESPKESPMSSPEPMRKESPDPRKESPMSSPELPRKESLDPRKESPTSSPEPIKEHSPEPQKEFPLPPMESHSPPQSNSPELGQKYSSDKKDTPSPEPSKGMSDQFAFESKVPEFQSEQAVPNLLGDFQSSAWAAGFGEQMPESSADLLSGFGLAPASSEHLLDFVKATDLADFATTSVEQSNKDYKDFESSKNADILGDLRSDAAAKPPVMKNDSFERIGEDDVKPPRPSSTFLTEVGDGSDEDDEDKAAAPVSSSNKDVADLLQDAQKESPETHRPQQPKLSLNDDVEDDFDDELTRVKEKVDDEGDPWAQKGEDLSPGSLGGGAQDNLLLSSKGDSGGDDISHRVSE